MSSNSNHTHIFINRENYEEYFLLLVDNELTKEEQSAVEAFLAANHVLQPVLDLLLSLKLPAEESGFLNKEILLAEGMRINQMEESLLLYIDNELNKEDQDWLENKISGDVGLQARHQQLLRTKLDATEPVRYPFKDELYRHEAGRKVPVYRMLAAAGVLMAITIGGLTYFMQQPASTAIVITEPGSGKNVPPAAVISPANGLEQKAEQTQKISHSLVAGEAKATMSLAKQASPKASVKKKVQPPYKAKTINGPSVPEKALDNGVANTPQITLPQSLPQQPLPKQSINNEPVTNGTVASYNNEDAPLSPAVIRDALVKTDNEKKSSLKGLLRKATRFIERRTNISATNENDELLIGAVALKL